MNHLAILRDYLSRQKSLTRFPASGNPFVTISRQPGAGGHLLSQVLWAEFGKPGDPELLEGWHVFDRELCELLAVDPELHTSMEELVSERYRSESHDFIESFFTGMNRQRMIHKKTFEMVRILASIGRVIIVGRAGSCVTRDLPGGLHIRLVASGPTRIRWVMRKFKVSKDDARRMIRRQEADRRKLVGVYFHRDIDDPTLYDAVFNMESMDPEHISRAIKQLVLLKAAQPKAT